MNNDNQDLANRIVMQGVHVELTAAMQAIIREKFSVLLRHNDRIIRIVVRLQQDQHRGQNHHYNATGQIELGGPDLVASAKGSEAYTVLDALVEKLDELLRERHERRKDRRNHPQPMELAGKLPKVESEE